MNKHQKYKKDFRVSIFDNFIDGLRKLITLPFQSSANKYSGEVRDLKIEYAQTKWDEIQELLSLGGPARFKQAVIEADKLFDLVLKNSGARGENMGMRLKNAQKKFTWEVYQGTWQAHKIRNEIVHQSDREILNHEAIDAVDKFKKGLNELHIL